MNEKLFEALDALCMMWEQYCGDEWGHMCMSAGENAEHVLTQYNLLIYKEGYQREVNWDKLEELKREIV